MNANQLFQETILLTEPLAHAIQIQQNIRQYDRFLRLIEKEMEKGSVDLVAGTKARIHVLLAIQNAEEDYYGNQSN